VSSKGKNKRFELISSESSEPPFKGKRREGRRRLWKLLVDYWDEEIYKYVHTLERRLRMKNNNKKTSETKASWKEQ